MNTKGAYNSGLRKLAAPEEAAALKAHNNNKRHSMSDCSIFLRLPQVMEKTGLKRASLYAFVKKGTFPAPLKLSERCSAWDSVSVLGWMEERKASRKNT